MSREMKPLINDNRGFTLLEILTVLALTVIIMGLVFWPLVNSFNLTRQADVMVRAQDNARLALSLVSRDLAMIKVNTSAENRAEIMQYVEIFRAHIIDISNTSIIIEITGDEEKINGFIDVLRPLGIIEMVRTGMVAMARGATSLISNNGKLLNELISA